MDKIIISAASYSEIINFIESSNIKDKNVRTSFLGGRCSGHKFHLTASEAQATDYVEKMRDVNFIIDQSLIEECSGFTVLSSQESKEKTIN